MSDFVDRKKEELRERLVHYEIPGYMHESVINYIMFGSPVGHFLTAIFSNDLKEAVAHGDEPNQAKIVEYVKFLYNDAPAGCWGSPERYRDWINHRGMKFQYPEKENYAYPDGHGEPPAKA